MSNNITDIFGAPFTPPKEEPIKPIEHQIRDAMAEYGFTVDADIHIDGQIHRFDTDKKKDKAGWYVFFSDKITAGQFGCWKNGTAYSFKQDMGRELDTFEEIAYKRRIEESKAKRKKELEQKHKTSAETATEIWANATLASADHPYLVKKGIDAHGLRVTGDGRLIAPLYKDDELCSLQFISDNSDKKYLPGGQTQGAYHIIGDITANPIYICEGFATGATIHEHTQKPVVIAYNASNLVPVSSTIRERLGATADLVIVADNDASNTGQAAAEKASKESGARVILPPIEGDANDYAQNGGDLAALLEPPKSEWLVPADDFCQQPAPIQWLIKHHIQRHALIMIHGPSGGGKTFVVLDMCLSIATGNAEWFGHKVRQGSVVYLAGEGHHGLRGRIAAWKQHNKADSIPMWLSKTGTDLNTLEGLTKARTAIQALPQPPALIVVDTLHRFLQGDENSAQDAKTMLDACGYLMDEFACSVVLVHHTGVSDEAQHRARGSSAWRGALDIELSVKPGRDDLPMELVQRKSKDAEIAEPMYCELETVEIDGWIDEDGEPVKSAIVRQEDAPEVEKSALKVAEFTKLFDRGWCYNKMEIEGGKPYVSRSGLVDFLQNNMSFSRQKALDHCDPTNPKSMIFTLLNAEIIQGFGHGFQVICPNFGSVLMMKKTDSQK